MVALIIFLILMFILYELYFVNMEKFTSSETEYDHYFDGNIFMKDDKTPTNIGIGTEPNSEYLIDVNGKLTINGDLRVGQAILNYNLAKKINKLPLYTKNSYCLYEKDGQTKQCVNESQLGMITGHTKVMFKNKYGEVLKNLPLRHHGNHDASESGRPGAGRNPWAEGFNFRDFNVDGRLEEHDLWNMGYRNNSNPHSLENSLDSTANNDNQFKLIPISNIETRLTGDESNVKNIVLYHPGSHVLLRPSGDSFKRLDNKKEYANKYLWNLTDSIDNQKKLETKNSISSSEHGPVYLKLEKIPNSSEFYIRVFQKDEKWRYLRVLSDSSEIVPSSILDDYPSGVNRFTITNTETRNTINFDSIKQFVTIKGSNGRNLCFGTLYAPSLYGRFAMRFLDIGSEYDWKFLLYIEPSVDEGNEEEDFVERKKYTCN